MSDKDRTIDGVPMDVAQNQAATIEIANEVKPVKEVKDTIQVTKNRVVIESHADGQLGFDIQGNIPIMQAIGVLELVKSLFIDMQKQAMQQATLQQAAGNITLANGMPPAPKFRRK